MAQSDLEAGIAKNISVGKNMSIYYVLCGLSSACLSGIAVETQHTDAHKAFCSSEAGTDPPAAH